MIAKAVGSGQTLEKLKPNDGSAGPPRPRLRPTPQRCEKRHFLHHLYIKTKILPRQARDKHRESTLNKEWRFVQVYEYGVVFIPGTGAGAGPAYRHRPARNKYPVSENGFFARFCCAIYT